MHRLAEKTEVPIVNFVAWLGIARAKFYEWRRRYGKVNEHNGKIPRDHWIEPWERQTIIDYFDKHPLEGYRRLTFMMLDDDIVAVSPATVYRVLRTAGRLERHPVKPTKKGTGFVQPLGPHMHWHIDIAVITIAGMYYYLCSVLDGYSRVVVQWDFLDRMTEADVELIPSALARRTLRPARASSPTTARSSSPATSAASSISPVSPMFAPP